MVRKTLLTAAYIDLYWQRYKEAQRIRQKIENLIHLRNLPTRILNHKHLGFNVLLFFLQIPEAIYSKQILEGLSDLAEKLGVHKVEFTSGNITRIKIIKKETEMPRFVPRFTEAGVGIPLGLNTEDLSEVWLNLNHNPHLLIAGATGQGKSVCLTNIILHIDEFLEDAKLILIDPKRIELSQFKDLKSLAQPIITDTKEALKAVEEVCREMDSRYSEMQKLQTKDFHKLHKPRLFLVIDEYSDLMMLANKICKRDEEENDLELNIARIGQLGRAAGIHIIIATQRPSVDVVTGLIKANIPTRIAFSTASGIDAKIILDEVQTPSKKLPGYGVLKSEQGFQKFKSVYISESSLTNYLMQNTVAPPPVFIKRRIRGLVMPPKYGGVVVPIQSEANPDREIKISVSDKFFYGVSQVRIKEYLKKRKGDVWKNVDFRNEFKISHSQANEFGKYLREKTSVLKQGRRRTWLIDEPEALELK